MLVALALGCAGPAPSRSTGGEPANAKIAAGERGHDAAVADGGTTTVRGWDGAADTFWPPPLDLRLAVEIDHEHGCSQSFENRGASALFELRVVAGGDAELTMTLDESTVFGPSLGRFQQGDRDFHHRYWKERTTWLGKASYARERIEIRFDRRKGARAEVPRYGERKLPAAKAGPATLTLTCGADLLDEVYPAVADDGIVHVPKDDERATPHSALLCKPSAELFDLIDLVYLDGALPFGREPGLAVGNWVMFGGGMLVVRRGR